MHRLVATIAVAVACHHDAPPRATVPPSTAVQDVLWAKAPDHVMFGAVVSPRGMIMIEHAWHDLHAFLASLAAFAPIEHELHDVFAKMGIADLVWSEIGVDPSKGLALFLQDDLRTGISIFGITDRDKFVARSLGTRGADYDRLPSMICKPIDGGYYGCTKGDIANLQRLGKGNVRALLARVQARGDLEAVVAMGAFDGAAVMQMDRGSFVLRGSVGGLPAKVFSLLGGPTTPGIDLDHVSGFGVVNVAPFLAQLPPVPIFPDVTTDDLVRSIAGPLTTTAASDDLAADARIPLHDTGPATRLVRHCGDIPTLADLGARLEHGMCRIPFPTYGSTGELGVVGNDLVFRIQRAAPIKSEPTDLGRELAAGAWLATFWGRGTYLSRQDLFAGALMRSGRAPAELAARAFSLVEEVGLGVSRDADRLRFVFGVRTVWSNPDDVIAKVLAIDPSDVLAGKGGEISQAIADASPRSPFAADRRAGSFGLAVSTAAVALVAGLALPAALDSHEKHRASHASTTLNDMGSELKLYYEDNGTFPVGDSGTLPDFPTCCGLSGRGHGIDNLCPSDVSAWRKNKIWSELDFALDEPTPYRYAYHSDGKTFVVTASGDTDCDGKFATYTLKGEVQAGAPVVTLVKPAPGVY